MSLVRRFRVLSLGLIVASCLQVCMAQDFIFNKFKVRGVARLDVSTVLHYLPFKAGESVSQRDMSNAVRAMYKTGLFRRIEMLVDGRTLVIKVEENPTIARILIEGGEKVGQNKIMEALKSQHLQVGRVLQPSVYHLLKQSVIEFYQQSSYHNVKVVVQQEKLAHNRVVVKLIITEGREGEVRSISFSGNKQVSSSKLSEAMSMAPKLWSIFTHNNYFSSTAYRDDLVSIAQYYYNLGYLQARVVSHKEVWDGDDVDLLIKVQEGQQFFLSKVLVNSTQYQADLQKLIKLKTGQRYNNRTVHAIVTQMYYFLAEKGYAYAVVSPRVQLNPKMHKVDVVFRVTMGTKVMVRRVEFHGNKLTQDHVLRRQMQQLESSQYNKRLIDLSLRKINNLGYIRNARCVPKKVGGRSDVVDLDCHLEETSTTMASASAGYSSQAGIIYKLNFDKKNFMGTGRQFLINAEKSDTVRSADVSYTDPYFLDQGISQSFKIFGQSAKNVKGSVAKYRTDDYGFSSDFGFPLSNFSRLVLGLGYKRSHIINFDSAVPYIQSFVDEHGTKFDTYDFHLGWRSNTYDRFLFPNRGVKQSLSAVVGLPIGEASLRYYQLHYTFSGYHPILNSGFVGQFVTQLGYGRGYGKFDELPFFKNYWAGGEGSLRGFATNSLGPVDSIGNPMGGNVLTIASLNVFAPQWLNEDSRFGFFVDVGNIFDDKVDFDQIRVSGGLMLQWRTPMAPIVLSLGYPIVKKDGDKEKTFSFSISTGL